MATLAEIRDQMNSGHMTNLVEAAIMIKAADIVANESGVSAARIAFAENALDNPETYSKKLWAYMVGANSSASIDQIDRNQGSSTIPTDATIKTHVNAGIDVFWP